MTNEEKKMIEALKALIKNENKVSNKPSVKKVKQVINPAQRTEKKNLFLIDYSEKAVAINGTEREDAPYMKEAGGRFNSNLSFGAGWIFVKSKWEEAKILIEKNFIINSDVKEVEVNEEELDEYEQSIKDEEEVKTVSATLSKTMSLQELLKKAIEK